MPRGHAVRLSAVVVTSHDCRHAEGVLAAVRSQMANSDELIVVEPQPCDRVLSAPGERHISATTTDDFVLRIAGIAESTGDLLLVLEDHGIPGPRFVAELTDLFERETALNAATFFVANGTLEEASSRALYLYICSNADPSTNRRVPGLVGSTFAMSGVTLRDVRERARDGNLEPGTLEYDILPAIANRGLDDFPAGLVIVHFQRNTLAEAMRANYWNARVLGWRERHRVPLHRAVPISIRRYIGHPVRLLTCRSGARPVFPQLSLLGGAALSGWWVGRYAGQGCSADILRDVHLQPAPCS